MKKNLLFIALFFLSFSLQAQYYWISQATGFADVSTGVRNVSAVDANVVWISTYDGSGGGASRTNYSKTTDGGLTWTPGTTPAPATYDWSMIYAHNADTAWAMYYDAVAGSGGGIYFTGNGGATWAQQGAGTIFNATSFPDIVYFWDGLQGVSIGDPNGGEFEIYTTVDAGNNWTAVSAANIPNPLAGEFAIVGHYSSIGNTIWFDTNKGRVYKSSDNGLTWTVAVTGITVPTNDAMNICFYSANDGLARLYNATTGANIMKTTSDGGTTWNAATPTGNFFGSDVAYVPGTSSRLISTGAATGFIGSSFSDDGGLTWVDFETTAQRTALGAVDSNNIWAGGFTTSPNSDGIFKYTYVPFVPCADTNITTGVVTATNVVLCPGDTMDITATGVYTPNDGTYSGVSWVISTTDISGSTDPLNVTNGFVTSYTFNFPAPTISTRRFINDGAFIGSILPFGTYYWTPVVFGNATAINVPPPAPVFLQDLVLDPACTHTGTSIMVQVLNSNTAPCGSVLACTDASITAGVSAANSTVICPGDTLVATSTGIVTPNSGDFSGSSWVITTADISGSTDPLNEPSIITSYTFEYPGAISTTREYINDGTFIGSVVSYGTYYWTPVVYGNAVVLAGLTTAPHFLQDFTLDPSCTHAGTSLMIQVLDGTDPLCGAGINDPGNSQLTVKGNFSDGQTLNLAITSVRSDKAIMNIYDLTGKLILSRNLELAAGTNTTSVEAKNFGAGLYFVEVETGSLKAVSKIAKQ